MATDKRSRIDHDSPKPLWRQVADDLAGEILAGEIHSRLPNEAELGHDYGVGRTTIRRAILELSERGLVEVSHGRGTFVIQPE